MSVIRRGPDEIRSKGHRVGLEDIVALHRDGFTVRRIAEDRPGLFLHKIEAAIRYHLERKADVDASMARLAALEDERVRDESGSEPPAVVR